MNNISKIRPCFNISNDHLNKIKNIERKLELIEDVSSDIEIKCRARAIHSSLAIESNTLSLEDVEMIMYDRIVFGDEEDIKEVKNINELYRRIERFNWRDEEDFIGAYVLMMEYFCDNNFYRDHGEGIINGGKIIYMAPNSLVVPSLMRSLFDFIRDNEGIIHSIILSSLFHYYFVYIHPFSDGNGRMARFWMHLMLFDWNSKFKNIPIEEEIFLNQEKYYDVINECHNNGNANKFIDFMLDVIDNVLEKLPRKTTQKNKLNFNQVRIIKLIKDNPKITRKEISSILNITSDGVKYNLKKLCDNNIIKRVGPDNGGYWKVVD